MLYLFVRHRGDVVALDEAALRRPLRDRDLPLTAPNVCLWLLTMFCLE